MRARAFTSDLFTFVRVRYSSYGRGGWKYQLLAVFLTYASIVTSYVPFVVKGIVEAGKKEKAAEQAKTDAPSRGQAVDEAAASAGAAKAARPAEKKATLGGFLLAWLLIFGIAFAAPFLGASSNIMGLIIIAIALYEAWKLNRRIPVTGPFRIGGGVAAAPSSAGTP